MFNNSRYLTCGVDSTIPLELQLFMWNCVDGLPEERDYLQVLNLNLSVKCRESRTHQKIPNTKWSTSYPQKHQLQPKFT